MGLEGVSAFVFTILNFFAKTARWIFGSLSFIAGLVQFFDQGRTFGILTIAASLMIIPPTGRMLAKKLKFSPKAWHQLAFVFLILASIAIGGYREFEAEVEEDLDEDELSDYQELLNRLRRWNLFGAKPKVRDDSGNVKLPTDNYTNKSIPDQPGGGGGGDGEPELEFNPPQILPPGQVGVLYQYSFCKPDLIFDTELCGGVDPTNDPTGGNPPYHFQLDTLGGFPPFDFTLNLNGLLEGTPKTASNTVFSVCAVDESADFVCIPVNLVIALAAGPGEQGEEEEDDPEEEEPEQETIELTIDSITCDLTGVDQFGDGVWDITASGTAKGPENGELQITYQGSSGGGGTPQANCASWGPSSLQTCKRGFGEPATTSWSFEWNNMRESSTFSMFGYEVYVTLRIFQGNSFLAEESGFVTCPR